MSISDWQEDDTVACPSCGHSPTRMRSCTAIGCDGGRFSLSDEDPIYYDADEYASCDECNGTGMIRWCPACGTELVRVTADEAEEYQELRAGDEHEWREHEWRWCDLGNGVRVRVTPDVQPETLDALRELGDALLKPMTPTE